MQATALQLQSAQTAAAEAAERHALAVVRAHTPQAPDSDGRHQHDDAERQAQQYHLRLAEVSALELSLAQHHFAALKLQEKLQAYLEQVDRDVQLSASMLEDCPQATPVSAPVTMVRCNVDA